MPLLDRAEETEECPASEFTHTVCLMNHETENGQRRLDLNQSNGFLKFDGIIKGHQLGMRLTTHQENHDKHPSKLLLLSFIPPGVLLSLFVTGKPTRSVGNRNNKGRFNINSDLSPDA